MKKIISTILLGSATLGSVGVTSLSVASCSIFSSGHKGGKKSQSDEQTRVQVLGEALTQVIADKKAQTLKSTTNEKSSFTISRKNIYNKVLDILRNKEIKISPYYFDTLSISGSFVSNPNNGKTKGSVSITQSPDTSAITVSYKSGLFSDIPTNGDLKTTNLLGKMTIQINEPQSSGGKLVSSTVYSLHNNSSFMTKDGKWNASANASTFHSNTGGSIAKPKKWLAVSANPENRQQLIGVSPKALWYSGDRGITWFASARYNGIGREEFLKFVGNNGDNNKYGFAAQTARIVWNGSTAYISASTLPGRIGQTGNGTPGKKYSTTVDTLSSLGDLWVCRLGGILKQGTSDLVSVGKQHHTIKPFLIMGYGDNGKHSTDKRPINEAVFTGQFHVDDKGNLIYATTWFGDEAAPGATNSDQNQGVYIMYASTIAKINVNNQGEDNDIFNGRYGQASSASAYVNSNNPNGPDWLGGPLENMSISPDGKNIWLGFYGGGVLHSRVTNPNTSSPTLSKVIGRGVQYAKPVSSKTYNGTSESIIANNKGVYAILSGDGSKNNDELTTSGHIHYIGFVSNDNEKTDMTSKVINESALTETKGTWSYNYVDKFNKGANAYGILSTGNEKQTLIINPNDEPSNVTPTELSGFKGFYPAGTIINPDNSKFHNQGLIFDSVTQINNEWSNLSGNTWFLSNNKKQGPLMQSITTSAESESHISALSTNDGYLSINDEVFHTGIDGTLTKVNGTTHKIGTVPLLNTLSNNNNGTLSFDFASAWANAKGTPMMYNETYRLPIRNYNGSTLSWT